MPFDITTSPDIGDSTKKSDYDRLRLNDKALASADFSFHGEKTFHSSTVFHMSATFDGTVNLQSATTTYFAPVSGEPSFGTGHFRGDNRGDAERLNQNPTVANTFYDVTFSEAEEGTKAAWAYISISAVGRVHTRRKGDTAPAAFGNAYFYAPVALSMLTRIPIDSDKKGQVAVNAAVVLKIGEAQYYDI